MVIKTIAQVYSCEIKSHNSKFIGNLYPFLDKSDIEVHLSQLKIEHSKANHFCYAYRIGYENEEFRSNDDGEPSGSAGKPILNQLYSAELKNCLVIVVRYFGGTKLGIPGLIEAYKETTKACILKAEIVEKEEMKTISIALNQDAYYIVIKQLKAKNITIMSSSFDRDIYQLKICLPISSIALISEYIIK